MNKQQSDKAAPLDRQELIQLVQKLLDIEGTYDDEQEQWKGLQANFYDWLAVLTDIHYVVGGLHSMTAEEIVDKGFISQYSFPRDLSRSEHELLKQS